MSWFESLIPAALNLFGSSQQASAAGDASAANAEAARIAAEAAAFRPVGLTTRFGKSGFNYDAQGNLQGAGYQVAPDLAAMREGMLGMAGGSLAQVQQMRQLQPFIDESATNAYKLGTQYMAQSPEQAGQDWMNQQQRMLAPQREQQLAKVRNDLQQSGRAGLAFGATEAGNLAATNPEMAAYYNSIANQNNQLAAQADAYGQQRTSYGIGLMGSGMDMVGRGYGLQTAAMAPWQQYMQGAQSIESMGQGAMDQSTALGAKSSTAGANQAQYLNRSVNGGTGYSPLGAGLMGLANNQTFLSGINSMFNAPPTGYTQQPGFTNTPNYLTWK
jgi:hypothetical protein